MTIDTAQPPAAGRQLEADSSDRPEGDNSPGRTELGLISINDQVVQKLAARAAADIDDAGAAATKLLGRAVGRQSSLSALPKASASVDGSTVVLSLSLSVRWPASVPAVTIAVREHVTSRVRELTGLTVSQFDISVTDLVTNVPPPPRAL